MPKIVTIHQPNYLPWIGLFSKIKQSDCFIIYDNVQYTVNSVINRNKIRTSSGACYLTIPINKVFSTRKIVDVPLPENHRWKTDHWKTIQQNYARSRFFKEHVDFFDKLYQENFEYLWQLNEMILVYLLKAFNVQIEIFKASELGVNQELHGTDLLIDCVKKVKADIYISGPSGRDYLEVDKFHNNNIELKYFKFEHPVYAQRYPGFIPNLSAIDLLFNMGPEANTLMSQSGSIE